MEFPVEIVGRDGMVRHHGFEDAVRLYQRRITFASGRWPEAERVRDEVTHCRARIDQLRRSYFVRHGWGVPSGQVDPLETFGEWAGEIAAFLLRTFRDGDRPDVLLEPLDVSADGEGRWAVFRTTAPLRTTLTLWRFSPNDVFRDGFLSRLRELERHEPADEVVVAVHHAADGALLLTAAPEEVAALAAHDADGDELAPVHDPGWSAVLATASLSTPEGTARVLSRLLEQQPWHRRAWRAAAALAIGRERADEAALLAQLGRRRLTDDALLLWLDGVALTVAGRGAAAVGSLGAFLRDHPHEAQGRAWLGLAHLSRGAYLQALLVGQLPRRIVRVAVAAGGATAVAAVLGLGAGATAWALGQLAPLALAIPAWFAVLGARVVVRRAIERERRGLRLEDPLRVLRRYGKDREGDVD